MLDQSFMRHIDGKYRSATAPFVWDCFEQNPPEKIWK